MRPPVSEAAGLRAAGRWFNDRAGRGRRIHGAVPAEPLASVRGLSNSTPKIS